MIDRARLWLRSVFLRRRLEREMQEEMADHLERAAARLRARGLAPAQARREALREFGNVAFLQEEARDARGGRWAEALATDARYALRQYARRPATTLTMFVVLAVGMSISTLLFSFVHSYAVQPPAGVARADDLVRIRGSRSAGEDGRGVRTFGEEELRAYRGLTGTFRAVAAWTDATVALAAGDDAERQAHEAWADFVTDDYFSVLGVRPRLGPGLPAEGERAGPVAVIGHLTWLRLFGGRPDVVGATVTVNGVPVTVVGVAPERFLGVRGDAPLRLWMPQAARSLVAPGPAGELRAVARLRPGVSPDEATAAVRVVAERAAAADPELRALQPSADVVPLLSANGDPMFERDVWLMSLLVGLLALLVLLVTCTNVSALLAGLATARRQEIAVRLSLGAARGRIVRQLLTESALLATAAGAAALAIVAGALWAVARLLPALPADWSVTVPAAAFTFGVALAVGVGFGLSPALHGTRLALAGALRDSAGAVAAARAPLQRRLVVAQVAFTQPLVVLLAAVLLAVLGQVVGEDGNPRAERLVSVSLRPSSPVAGATPEALGARRRLRRTTERVAERLRATPGVEAAVVEWGGEWPLGRYVVHPDDRVPGTPSDPVRLAGEHAAPGYFAVAGTPVLRGREFVDADVAAGAAGGESAVVLGDDLARRLWPGEDPVGRRLSAAADGADGARTLVVVGVVPDPAAASRQAGDEVPVYLPPDTARAPWRLLARTAGPAEPLLPALRDGVGEETAGMLATVRTVAEMEEERRRWMRRAAGGLTAAGAAALLLSALGLYAVVALSVGQRTREIAVRMAVGAGARQIVRRFLGEGVRLGAFGLALGLPAGLAGVHLLFSADADLPSVPLGLVTAIAAAGVLSVAAAAAWLPARRAAAVDPAVALRSE